MVKRMKDLLHQPTKIRPMLTRSCPLEHVPRDWLLNVAPHVVMPPHTTCWLWTGGIEPRSQLPIKMINRKRHYMRRYVMQIFWDIPDTWYVRGCKHEVRCVNPNHLSLDYHHHNANSGKKFGSS